MSLNDCTLAICKDTDITTILRRVTHIRSEVLLLKLVKTLITYSQLTLGIIPLSVKKEYC